jgi:ankyrin repeat protein
MRMIDRFLCQVAIVVIFACASCSATREGRKLYAAYRKADYDYIIQAIDHGINPDAPVDKEGSTLLDYAGAFGPPEFLRALIARGAKVDHVDSGGGTPLMMASALGNVVCVEILLDHNAKINYQNPKNGKTPLHVAATNPEKGHLAAQILVQHGANLELKDNEGKTAFDIARERNYREFIDALNRHKP